MSALNFWVLAKAGSVWAEKEESVRCENGPNKTTKDHNYHQLARQDLLPPKANTLDTSHLLRSALNFWVLAKAGCVWGEKEERVRCEMNQVKTTKDHHYQQLARQDLPLHNIITLDTSHLLRSALNAAAFQKAVVFGMCLEGERRKGQMWNGPNKNKKDHHYH